MRDNCCQPRLNELLGCAHHVRWRLRLDQDLICQHSLYPHMHARDCGFLGDTLPALQSMRGALAAYAAMQL